MSKRLFKARCVRSGRWWAIRVPELPGVHSQAKTLDQAEGMAVEAISLFLEVDPNSISVEIEPELPPELQADVERARRLRSEAEARQQEAVAVTAEAAAELVQRAHLSLRDAGRILGVSHQRVAQLLAS
jgi:predicted RNase H-like HicB family nuclease